MMLTKKTIRYATVHDRKHHIIEMGDMMFCNGYGIRYDCHECRGGYVNGAPCKICGELRD